MVTLFAYNLIYHLLASLWQDLTPTFLCSLFTYPQRKQKHYNESFWYGDPQTLYSPLTAPLFSWAPVLREGFLEKPIHLGAGASRWGRGSCRSQLSPTAQERLLSPRAWTWHPPPPGTHCQGRCKGGKRARGAGERRPSAGQRANLLTGSECSAGSMWELTYRLPTLEVRELRLRKITELN